MRNKIEGVRVDWMEGWGNRPRFMVAFEERDDTTFVYRDLPQGMLLAVDGERAEWFHYGGPGKGFGGRRFPITMVDGSKRELIGPWSSNSGAVNDVTLAHEHVVEAVTLDQCSTGVTVAGLLRYIDEHPFCRFGLVRVKSMDSVWYEPTRYGELKGDTLHEIEVLEVLR